MSAWVFYLVMKKSLTSFILSKTNMSALTVLVIGFSTVLVNFAVTRSLKEKVFDKSPQVSKQCNQFYCYTISSKKQNAYIFVFNES